MDAKTFKEQLATWSSVNETVMEMTEKECEALLRFEEKNQARLRIMLRIHSRLCRLRYDRERGELVNKSKTTGYTSRTSEI